MTVKSSGPIVFRLSDQQVLPGLDSSKVPLPATSMTTGLRRRTSHSRSPGLMIFV